MQPTTRGPGSAPRRRSPVRSRRWPITAGHDAARASGWSAND